MGKINFYSKTSFSFTKQASLSKWIYKVCLLERFVLNKISFIALNKEGLLQINKKHLGRNYFTDVITFDYSKKRALEGDVFFSVDDVKQNAICFNTSFNNEILRVMVHGVLHLIGYDDNSVSKKAIIKKKEDQYVALYFNMFHMKPFGGV